MRVRHVLGLLVAAMLLSPGAVRAAPLLLTLSGTTTAYGPYNDAAASFPVTVPLGASVTGSLSFDDGILAIAGFDLSPAGGTLAINGVTYSAAGVRSAGAITLQSGGTFNTLLFTFSGPAIAPSAPGDKPGLLQLNVGIGRPDLLGTAVTTYPYNTLGVGYSNADNTHYTLDYAELAVRAGAVTPVPEPSGALLLVPGTVLALAAGFGPGHRAVAGRQAGTGAVA